MSDSDCERIRSEAEAICSDFGQGSRIVEVQEFQEMGATITLDLPKSKEKSEVERQRQLVELRDRLQAIRGVDSVHLLIGSR